GSLNAAHPYKDDAPDFSDPSTGVDVTLYWGTIDGGTDVSLWEHEVNFGNYYAEAPTNGFYGYGFPRDVNGLPGPNDSYMNDIETLIALPHAGSSVVTGEPNNPAANGFFFNGDGDFKNAGIGIAQNDNYMSLFIADFNAPESGNYKFKMDQKDDRTTIWLDLDQNGVFSSSGAAGNEKMGGNNNWTSGDKALVGGETYKIALAHAEWGGGSKFRAWYQTPSVGMTVITPLKPSQNGHFTVK
ncbi:uncharacterized protein METZ01_LOCUS482095, partial [marine metagenome]